MSANPVCSKCGRPARNLNPAKMCSGCVTDELLGKMHTDETFRSAHSMHGMEEDLRRMQEDFLRAQMDNPRAKATHTIDPIFDSVWATTAKAKPAQSVTVQELDAMRARAMKAELEARCLKAHVQQLETQIALLRSQPARPHTNGTIPQDKVKSLLRLVHPDLHKNSELSTEMTKWLLSLREKH